MVGVGGGIWGPRELVMDCFQGSSDFGTSFPGLLEQAKPNIFFCEFWQNPNPARLLLHSGGRDIEFAGVLLHL